ncbi:MAG: NTP transferase domain-containing protein [Clostridia bacterium]|nr:NTP transferase domain-containing protein [Clostridia bacterium]MDD4375407.1 NTP transferase domain-containing protein [Clostridia bacterium]
MDNYKAIILCGGLGKRMNSDIPKALHKVFDKTISRCVVDSITSAGIKDICMILGHKAEMIIEEFKDTPNISYAYQTELLGTGHAVMQAVDFIKENDKVLVIYGDMPLITKESIEGLISNFASNNYAASVMTAIVDNPFGYGRIIRNGKDLFEKIVEEKDASPDEKQISEVNLGVYMYNGADLLASLKKLTNDNAQKEYYLTDTLYHILTDNKDIGTYVIPDATESNNVNSRSELAVATRLMLDRINKKHIENGVTIIDPNNTYIGSDVIIGKDTIIYPGTTITGNSIIGDNCIIECSYIQNSKVNDNSKISAFSNIKDKF